MSGQVSPSHDTTRAAAVPAGGVDGATVDWPTVFLLAAFFAAWLALVLGHGGVPWWLSAPALVFLGGLWMSFGHELLHGHPTRWNVVNSALGWLPLSLWLPFGRYKYWHKVHHLADLTDPIEDPESFYLPPEVWQARSRLGRSWTLLLRTVPGRLTLGTLRGIPRFWWREAKCLGERRILSQWFVHATLAVGLAWWLFAVVDMPVVEYVGAFCLGGSACTNLRSFLEHRAVADGTRSAVVKAGPVMSLLYLNNNLHHTHHTYPDLAWYRIPAAHRELGSDALAASGAGLYEGGYLEVLRRYSFHSFDRPDHPLSLRSEG